MATQDKEKIKELTRKIKDLEAALQQKEQLLHDYQDIEKIADEKIKGLNAIHAEKIRSLMNSIQLLKKENASLSKQSKEHKRSELIQQLNKDIADQDIVIEVLRGLIGDDKKADNAIIKELTKGPPRIRVQTREELKMEIRELKNKLLKYEKKKDSSQQEVTADNVGTKQLQAELRRSSIMSLDKMESRMGGANSEFILKINDLNNEIEDLKLVVAGKDAEIEKYKELISKKNLEIIELNQAKIDLKFVMTKNEELKGEIEALRQKISSDAYNNYDQQIKLEEMELVAATHKGLQGKTNEVAKLEIETLQAKLEDMARTNKQIMFNYHKLQDEFNTLKQQNEENKDKNRKLYADQTSEIEKLNDQLKERETNIRALTSELADTQDKLDKVTAALKNKDVEIARLQKKVNQLSSGNIIDNKSGISVVSNGSNVSELTRINENLEDEKANLEMELNQLRQENMRLRIRVKELTKIEIELHDKIELLEEESRLKSQKINAMNLIQKKNYNDTMTPEEVQSMLKETVARYEAKIRELSTKIIELEERNRELEEVRRIIQSPSLDGERLDSSHDISNSLIDKI